MASCQDVLPIRIESVADTTGDAIAEQVRRALCRSLDRPLSSEAIDTTVRAILRPEALQTLLASVPGVQSLMNRRLSNPALRIKLLNVSQAELAADLPQARRHEDTTLFKLVYEHEFGMFGGEPYAMIATGFRFGCQDIDRLVLETMARIGAEAGCQFVTSTSKRCFGIRDWQSVNMRRNVAAVFHSRTCMEWRDFRDSEPARYLAMTLPMADIEPDGYQQNGADAFALCAALVDELGAESKAAAGEASLQAGDAAAHDLIAMLIDNGLTPVDATRGALLAPLAQVPSMQRPRRYYDPDKSAAAKVLSQVSYNLQVNRFLRYITTITRDQLGAFRRLDKLEDSINKWLQDYVGAADDAAKPLAEARIKAREVAGAPGVFKIRLNIRIRRFGADHPPYTEHEANVVGF